MEVHYIHRPITWSVEDIHKAMDECEDLFQKQQAVRYAKLREHYMRREAQPHIEGFTR